MPKLVYFIFNISAIPNYSRKGKEVYKFMSFLLDYILRTFRYNNEQMTKAREPFIYMINMIFKSKYA